MILVVSHRADPHADAVLALLRQIGHPVVLFDTSGFPKRSSVMERFGPEGTSFELISDGRRIDLAACRAGWWRRPLLHELHDGLAPGVAAFTYTECSEALAGMWASLDIAWVNPPALDEQAQHKPYQLALAAELGLAVPDTLITNDPACARAFIERHGVGNTIYKTFLATEEHWRETRVVREQELPALDSVRLAPVIFQRYIPAVEDLRVTVVGEQVFPAAIRPAAGGYQIDYRMDLEGASYRPTELPDAVEKGLRRLMERLGLVYGAIDMRLTPEGEYVFLEVNPAGEWLFVEERTAMPITQCMANLLMRLDRR
ncbi:MAG: MvdC/MvdD family ATP grasp protein [Actinomycetota bacterium]